MVEKFPTVENSPEAVIPDEAARQVALAGLEKFAELPSKRLSLTGIVSNKDKDFVVTASRHIAKKLYRCPCCEEAIPIGSENTVISTISASRSYTHHHVHDTCFHDKILRTWSNVKTADPKSVTEPMNNKRRRNYRHNHRS